MIMFLNASNPHSALATLEAGGFKREHKPNSAQQRLHQNDLDCELDSAYNDAARSAYGDYEYDPDY